MKYPNDRKYTKDHEWAKLTGKTITVGITDHAQSALGDIVFVDLPQVGRSLKKGETFGVVESIKAVSDLYSPLDGKVVEINAALTSEPSSINRSAHEDAWMVRLDAAASQLDGLMSSAEYSSYVESLE